MIAENKYDDEPRLPTFEEALTEERLLRERSQLMQATKELTRLKREMEEKIRQEMEAKVRQEMEAKMYQEMEKAKATEEERKALEKVREEQRLVDSIKKKRRETVLTEVRGITPQTLYEGTMIHMMIQFVESNKIMLYYHLQRTDESRKVVRYALYLSETQVGIHLVFGTLDGSDVRQEIRPFYWFDSELSRRDLTLLENIDKPSKRARWELYSVTHFAALNCITNVHPSEMNGVRKESVDNFQTILRLIPGSYKNGPWRPLDGFFGPYLNEDTLEIISLIPEVL